MDRAAPMTTIDLVDVGANLDDEIRRCLATAGYRLADGGDVDPTISVFCLDTEDSGQLARLREYRDRHPGRAVIAVTPNAGRSTAWQATLHGASTCVTWPIEDLDWGRLFAETLRRADENAAIDLPYRGILPLGAFELDDGRLVYANSTFLGLLGQSWEQVASRSMTCLASDEEREELARCLGAVPTSSGPFIHTCRFLRNGSPVWLGELRMLSAPGSPARISGTLRDVTDERRLMQLHRRVLELGEIILGESDIDRILQLVLDSITEFSGFRRAVLSLYDLSVPSPLDGETVKLLASGLSGTELEELRRQQMAPEDRRQAFSERYRVGPAYYIPSGQSPWSSEMGISGTVSIDGWDKDDYLFIPLRGEAGIIGCISVDDPIDPTAPTAASIDPVASLATFAALAVERAFKLRQIERQKSRLHGLSLLGSNLSRVHDVDEVCSLAAQRAFADLGHDYCAIWVVDRQEIVLRGVAHSEGFPPEELLGLGERRPLNGAGITRAALASGEPITVSDVFADERYRRSRQSIRSMVAVPVPGRKGPLAVIDMESQTPDAIREDDVELLTTLANQLSITISGLARREAIGRVYAFGQRLATATDMDSVVSGTLDFLVDQAGFPAARLFLRGAGESLRQAGARSFDAKETESDPEVREVPGIACRVEKSKQCALAGDAPSVEGQGPTTLSARSELAAPILFDERLLGIIYVESPNDEDFDAEDQQLLELTSNHLAIALANLASQQSLREQAVRDSLTGLYNRHYFNEIISSELMRGHRYRRPLSLMMIDVDGFRAVNNTLGHLRGDEVLRDVARLLKQSMRSSDRVIRYGGDEFLIFMPETDREVSEVAARLKQGIRKISNRLRVDGISIGLSIGTYTRWPDDRGTLETILEEVDRRMYADKRATARGSTHDSDA